MSEVVALPDTPNEELAPFLDGEQKQEMIDQQHGFLITQARPHVVSTNPQFKDQVMYEIAFLVDGAVGYLEKQGRGESGKVKTSTDQLVEATVPAWASNSPRWMLALQHNPLREKQASLVLEKLALGHPMVGPCWMSEIPNDTPGFNPTRIIIGNPKPPITKPKKSNGSSSTQNQPARDAAPDESDGIPFAYDSTFRVTL